MKLPSNVSQSDKVCNMIIELVETKVIKKEGEEDKQVEVTLYQTVCKKFLNENDMKKLKDQIVRGMKDETIPLKNKEILKDEKVLSRYATNLLHDRLSFAKPINGNVTKSFKDPGKFRLTKNKEYKNLEISLASLKSQNAPQEQLDEVTTLMLIKQVEIEAEVKTEMPDLNMLPDSIRQMIESLQKKA